MDEKSRVYLTKRPKTMKFLAGYYVFPGGSVDLTDNITTSNYIQRSKSHRLFNLAHFIAAARELFEEVGILLAEKNDGTFVPFPRDKEMYYRRLLIKGKISFIQILEKEKLHFHLESLTYFGHRTTPKGSPIRFDTRFFLADLPKDQSPKPCEDEIDEAFWITPEEAIKAYQQGELLMALPTVQSLYALINHQEGGVLKMS